jgi:hypothetical protein
LPDMSKSAALNTVIQTILLGWVIESSLNPFAAQHPLREPDVH